ncbi:tetratricopeptide repeat protein [Orbaceae bacterium ac157xtp]
MINRLKSFMLLTLLGILSSQAYANNQACTHSTDEKNITLCTKLAEQGDAVAQNTLGEIYYQNALIYKGYHTKARILFEKAAEQGLAKAQYNLGSMYRDEFNNFPIALTWFEKAAAQGDLDAINSIGYIYENGSGGEPPRNYLYNEQGKNIDPELPYIEARFAPYEFDMPVATFPRTIYPLGEYGQGVEPDIKKAAEYYQKAASQGHALAQTNLAFLYFMGLGVEKDDKKAFELYQKAAAQQFVPAVKSLAFMYAQGVGTQEDIPKAFHLLEEAYTLQPEYRLWKMILHMQINKKNKQYQLKMSVADQDIPYREQFEANDSSDEDYLYERLQYLKAFYHLDMVNCSHIGDLYAWSRETFHILLGNTVGEISTLKERYYLKKSIQGYYITMQSLSYYYKAEEEDLPKAQLWRKYAIKMGADDHPGQWPGYDDTPSEGND